eukprot:746622-Hanusia_phi.AAC.2
MPACHSAKSHHTHSRHPRLARGRDRLPSTDSRLGCLEEKPPSCKLLPATCHLQSVSDIQRRNGSRSIVAVSSLLSFVIVTFTAMLSSCSYPPRLLLSNSLDFSALSWSLHLMLAYQPMLLAPPSPSQSPSISVGVLTLRRAVNAHSIQGLTDGPAGPGN